jgi:hypothetical protein
VTLNNPATVTKSPRDLLHEAVPMPVIIGNNRFEFGPPPGKAWPCYDNKAQSYVLFDRKGLMRRQKLQTGICTLANAL